VVRWFAHRRLLDPDDARDMLAWANGGFSRDASVRIAGQGWAGAAAALLCAPALRRPLCRV